MEETANGPISNGNGHDPGGAAKEAPGGTGDGREETGGGFSQQNGTGPRGDNTNRSDDARKTCREQGLVYYHVRGGNAGHWPEIKDDLQGQQMALSLQESEPFEIHTPGYLKNGLDGAKSGFGHSIFFPRAEVERMQSAKISMPMSAEMRECKEAWAASWRGERPSMVYLDEDFMMGSSDRTVLVHI